MMLYAAFFYRCGRPLCPKVCVCVLFSTHLPRVRVLPTAVATWRTLPWQSEELSHTSFFSKVPGLLFQLHLGDFPLCSPGPGTPMVGWVRSCLGVASGFWHLPDIDTLGGWCKYTKKGAYNGEHTRCGVTVGQHWETHVDWGPLAYFWEVSLPGASSSAHLRGLAP